MPTVGASPSAHNLAEDLLKERAGRTTGCGDGQGVGEMQRSIAAAMVVFGSVAFALHHTTVAGKFEEPVLLAVMGTLFLLASSLFGGAGKTTAPELVESNA